MFNGLNKQRNIQKLPPKAPATLIIQFCDVTYQKKPIMMLLPTFVKDGTAASQSDNKPRPHNMIYVLFRDTAPEIAKYRGVIRNTRPAHLS